MSTHYNSVLINLQISFLLKIARCAGPEALCVFHDMLSGVLRFVVGGMVHVTHCIW